MNSPLTQHVISICASITLWKVLISRKRLHQSNSNSARCVQHVQYIYTIDAACYLKSELASLRGNVWYLGNDFSNRLLTQRVVFSKSNRPLTQHVISIWACITLRKVLISRRRLHQSTSNSASCVQEVQSTSNAAWYLNPSLHNFEEMFDISETTASIDLYLSALFSGGPIHDCFNEATSISARCFQEVQSTI